MLKGLAKIKALKELKQIRQDKGNLKGLALIKAIKRQKEIRRDLGMDKHQETPTDKPFDLTETLTELIQVTGVVSLQSLPDDIAYNELKKSVMAVFKAKMRDTKVFCRPLNAQVQVRMSGAKHILNAGATRDKMVLLLKSVALIAGAKKAVELEVDSDKPNIVSSYLITTPIELNGKKEEIGQIVLTDDKGNLFYDLHIKKDDITSKKYKVKENGLSVILDDDHQAHSQAITELEVPASERTGVTQSFLAQSSPNDSSIANDDLSVNGFDRMGGVTMLVVNLFFLKEIASLLDEPALAEHAKADG